MNVINKVVDLEPTAWGHRRVRTPSGMSVIDIGPKDAPAVVLLHGWSLTAELNWLPHLDALSQDCRVVAPDLPGHGKTHAPRRFTLPGAADAVEATLADLHVDAPTIVGYSLGGMVAQHLWRRHPLEVAALVLASTTASLLVDIQAVAAAAVFGGLGCAAPLLPPVTRRSLVESLRGRATEHNDLESIGGPAMTWLRAQLRQGSDRSALEALAAAQCHDSRRWIRHVDVPVISIVTTNDHVVSPNQQRALAGAAGAKVIEVPGDHTACLSDIDRYRTALLEAVHPT